jgi:hypothetical protein
MLHVGGISVFFCCSGTDEAAETTEQTKSNISAAGSAMLVSVRK